MYPPHHLGGYELVWRSRCSTSARRVTRRASSQATSAHRPRSPTIPKPSGSCAGTGGTTSGRGSDGGPGSRSSVTTPPCLTAISTNCARTSSAGGRWGECRWRWSSGSGDSRIPAVAFVHDDWLLYAPHVDRWTRTFSGSSSPWSAGGARHRACRPGSTSKRPRATCSSPRRCAPVRAPRGTCWRAVTIAHSGIDPAYLDPRPERRWDWRMLYVGRVDERKGVSDAVAALEDLPVAAS